MVISDRVGKYLKKVARETGQDVEIMTLSDGFLSQA